MEYLWVGQCRHLECVTARGGDWKMIDFPSLCGLIHHPEQGWILFDTGYADHFHAQTKTLPESLYRFALPISLPERQKLIAQLKRRGLEPEDISLIIVSHYHGDHVAGLRDFPHARFIATAQDSHDIQQLTKKPWRATLQGKLPKMLPEDYFQRLDHVEQFRLHTLPSWLLPFEQGFDLLGDGSVLAVPLPGHSEGQLGLFLPDASGRPIFMVADACWSLQACQQGRLPSALAGLAIANSRSYADTFNSIRTLTNREPDLTVLPSHCVDSWKSFQQDTLTDE